MLGKKDGARTGRQSLGLQKKNLLVNFPNRLLKNTWIEYVFPYALLPYHEGAKQDTIGVIKGVCAKLPHCTSLVLIYSMENEMSLIHHIVEHWGCGYINEDCKGLNEKTQWHPMSKPKFKLMQVEWE